MFPKIYKFKKYTNDRFLKYKPTLILQSNGVFVIVCFKLPVIPDYITFPNEEALFKHLRVLRESSGPWQVNLVSKAPWVFRVSQAKKDPPDQIAVLEALDPWVIMDQKVGMLFIIYILAGGEFC